MRLTKKMMIIIALGLAAITFFQTPAKTLADSQPMYVSDIKISWVDDEDDAAKAKKKLEDAGYTVVKQDLNAGTNYWAVSDAASSFIGYKTTTNRDEAITDVSVMNMKGGYVSSNMQVGSQKSADAINELAIQMKIMCQEMKKNVDAKSPAAISAKYVLDSYIEDADTGSALGDYLLSSERKISDYYKIITVSNSMMLAMIYGQLAYGVAEYNTGSNWMERMSSAKDEQYDDKLYNDKAQQIRQSILAFAEKYESADKYQKKEGKIKADNIETEDEYNQDLEKAVANSEVIQDEKDDALYLGVYAVLEKYPYGDSNLAELFTNTKVKVKDLYPLVKSMTDGQLAALRLSGLPSLVLGCENTTEAFKDDTTSVDKYQAEVTGDTANAKLISNNKVSVWSGGGTLNDANEETGITSRAYRNMSKSGDYEELTSDKARLTDTMKMHIYLTGAVVAAAAAYTCIFVGIPGALTGVGTFAMLKAFWTGIAFTIKGVLGAVAGAGAAIGVVAVCLLVIMAAVWLGAKIYDAYTYLHPDYTVIPKTMLDLSGANYIYYEAVLDTDGNPGDLNGWDGKEWLAMYTTKDPNAGSPILANFMTSAFETVIGNGTTPDDCTCTHLFGESVAVNMNLKAYADRKGGIYLFYVTEESQGKKPSQVQPVTNTEGKPVYLSDVILVSEETEESARYAIEKKSDVGGAYHVVPYNLTRKLGYATYIGYRTTTNWHNAIKDLRVAYKYNTKQYIFGDASYGNCGTATDPDDSTETYTLYATTCECAGNPIYANFVTANSLKDAPEGFQAITPFSGGQAFDFNIKDYETSKTWDVNSYVYFSSAREYIKNVKLIAGSTESAALSVYSSLYSSDKTWRKYSENLSPGTGTVTYLAYQTTIDEREAIRDIKMATYKSLKRYKTVTIGDVEYTKAVLASNEEMDFSLLTTTDSRAGEPLWDEFLAVSDAKYAAKGYEVIQEYNIKKPAETGTAYQMADDETKSYLYVYRGGGSFLSGITFAAGNYFKDVKPSDMLDQLGCINSKINVGYCPPDDLGDYETNMGYSLTAEPKRALHDIEVRKGAEDEVYEQGELTIAGVGYAVCETYVQGDYHYFSETKWFGAGGWTSSGIGVQSIRATHTFFSVLKSEGGSCTDSEGKGGHCRAMYVTAATSVGEPLTIDKLCFRSDYLYKAYKDNKVFQVIQENEMPSDGYLPVKELGDTWDDEAGPVTLTPGTDFKSNVFKKFGVSYYYDYPIFLYILKEPEIEKPYIAEVGVAVNSGTEAYDELSAILQGLASGATDMCGKCYFTRTDDSESALTDIINVVMANDDKDDPPSTYAYHGMKYTLASSAPLIDTGIPGMLVKSYLYTSKNLGAGEPITRFAFRDFVDDISDLKENMSIQDNVIYTKKETLDTQEKLFVQGVAMYTNRGVITRTEPLPYIWGDSIISVNDNKFLMDIDTGLTATQQVQFDFNYNTGGAPISLIYNRTDDYKNEALTGLLVYNGQNPPTTLVKDNIQYTRVRGYELNADVKGDYLQLYYTTDEAAGKPISKIIGSINRNEKGYTVVKDTKDNVCDMNKGVVTCNKRDVVCYMHYQRIDQEDEDANSMASVFTEYQGSITIVAFSLILIMSLCIWVVKRKRVSNK